MEQCIIRDVDFTGNFFLCILLFFKNIVFNMFYLFVFIIFYSKLYFKCNKKCINVFILLTNIFINDNFEIHYNK